MDAKNKRLTERITYLGLISNIFLSIIKFILGVIYSSEAVIADAVHSMSDITTDIAIIFGVKYWSAPPDKNHPYGHKRIETVITTSIGLILLTAAILIAYKSIFSIQEQATTQPFFLAAIGPLISIIIKELLYRKTLKIGDQIRSSSLIANAWHHRTDALSSVPVLIAVIIASVFPGWAFIDNIGAFIVSLIILKVSYNILKNTISELTDRRASNSDIIKIQSLSMDIDGVKETHKIRTRKLGSGICLDLHVLVDENLSVRESHAIAEKLKLYLVENGPDIYDVVVHIEPYDE